MYWLKRGYQAARKGATVFVVELLRISPLLAIVAAFMVRNAETPALHLTATILAAVAIVLAFAHIVRKVLFPYLDLKLFFDSARASSVASANVILGVLAFLAFLVWLTISISLGAH